MFPTVTLHFFGSLHVFSAWLLTFDLSLFFGAVILIRGLKNEIGITKATTLCLVTTIAAVYGGRIFHAVWERPTYFAAHPLEVLQPFGAGTVFYGALIGGILAYWVLLFRQPEATRRKAWDLAAIAAALSVGFMRIGCFAEGCCWGTPTSVPWAVRFYDPHSEMPWLGIPVHPTQLYNAAAGFLIAAHLFWIFRSKESRFKGRLIFIFLIEFAIARFITEFYRGDSYRGVNLILGMSTSQILSVFFGIAGSIFLCRSLYFVGKASGHFTRHVSTAIALLGTLFGLSACVQPPTSPGYGILKSTQELGDGMSLHHMNRDSLGPANRNLLFVASDDDEDQEFNDLLKSAYPFTNPKPHIEEIAWWVYSGDIAKIYDDVIRIRFDKFSKSYLDYALYYLEKQGKSYDVALLTHGAPNYIASSLGFPLIGYKDIDALAGQIPHARMIYAGGCYGSTLLPDWKPTGAQALASFDGLNRNFFFYGFLLKNLEKNPDDFSGAFQQTLQDQATQIHDDPTYSLLISKFGLTVDQYLQAAPNPQLEMLR